MSEIRRYRIVVDLPPLREPTEYGARVRDHTYEGTRYIGYQWERSERILDAFDIKEALQRLEFQLLAAGYHRPGDTHLAIYRVIDVEPVQS